MSVNLFKLALPLGLVGVLSGCLSPLDQCLSSAGRESREIRRELTEARLDLSRGYRVEIITVPVLAPPITATPAICMGPGQVPASCARWIAPPQDMQQEIHHPINRANQRERIELLERQLDRAERREGRAAAQCRATYPAE